jgi:hypothetical protein
MNVLISAAPEQDMANSGAGAAHLFHTSIFRPAGVSPQPPRRISCAGSELPDLLRPVNSPDAGSITAQDRPGAMARGSGHRRSTGPISPIRPIRPISPISPIGPVKRPRIRAQPPAIIRENPCQSMAKKIVRGTPPAPADSRQS